MSAPAMAVRERPILFSAEMVRAILDGRKTQTRRVVSPRDWTPLSVDRGGRPALPEYAPEAVCDGVAYWFAESADGEPYEDARARCPYGAPGDRLWVREKWNALFGWPRGGDFASTTWAQGTERRLRVASRCERVSYAADESTYWCLAAAEDAGVLKPGGPILGESDYFEEPLRWMPGIFMPRWASRLALEVVGVRVERLQEITEADALAEGVEWGPNVAAARRGLLYAGGGVWRSDAIPARGPVNLDPGPVAEFAGLWDGLNGPRGFGWKANPWVWVVDFRRVSP